jgi:hypothetical protein
MADATAFIEQAPLQDRDLLQRLSTYFDGFDARLRQGQGWLIFNASDGRSRRISRFIQYRVADYQPGVSSYMMPWRDFALSAYVGEVGLPELAPAVGADQQAKREFELATRVTYNTWLQMLNTDLLVLVGLKPTRRHEAELLDRTLEGRYEQRLATIILTPEMPQDLEVEFASVDPSKTYWRRIFQRMYDTSLVAL